MDRKEESLEKLQNRTLLDIHRMNSRRLKLDQRGDSCKKPFFCVALAFPHPNRYRIKQITNTARKYDGKTQASDGPSGIIRKLFVLLSFRFVVLGRRRHKSCPFVGNHRPEEVSEC